MNYSIKRGVAPALMAIALLFGTPSVHSTASTGEQEVIAVYKNEAGKQAIIKASETIEHNLREFDALSISLTPRALEKLAENPNVDHIERPSETSLMGTEAQWNVEAVHAPEAWAEGYTGEGIKVAVIDSGVNTNHNDLDIEESISFVSDNPETTSVDESSVVDQDGHGTHVAGVISANIGGEKVYGRDVVGVAPDVELYSLKAIAKKEGNTLDIIEAIHWAIDHDMDIINLSVGSSDSTDFFEEAVNQAYEAGILVVGASGNDGHDTPVRYPARYDSVLAVSSVNREKKLSSFASIGPEVEFTAPGEPIVSTYEDAYATMGGTSQAAPHVTGLLALLKQKNPQMTAVELRQELRKYTTDLGVPGRDEKFGFGFIDYAAYDGIAPHEVTDVTLTDQQQEALMLAWQNPTDSDFQSVHVYLNGERIGETKETFFSFDHLQPSHSYTIELRTVDQKGNESEGVQIQAATKVGTYTQQLADRAATIQDKLTEAPETMKLWEVETAEYAIQQLDDTSMDSLAEALQAYKQSIDLKEFERLQMTPEKDLTIRFNTAMDETTINHREVFVRHEGAFVEGINVELSEDGERLTVRAPEGGYESGNYSLYIGSGLEDMNGQGLKSPVVMKFNL